MQIGLPALLGLLFIALKLTGFIAWSWVWVLAPFWIGAAVAFLAMLVWLVAVALATRR